MAQTIDRRQKESFIRRNTATLTGLLIVALFTVFVLVILLISARNLQEETLKRIDQPATGQILLGPKGELSSRSKIELTALLSEEPNVLAGWAVKLQYEKTEVPFIHTWARHAEFVKFIEAYTNLQKSGKGFSSEELNRDSNQSVRNSEEAKTGLIKCGPLSSTNIPKLAPGIESIAKGVCRATIPPFDENVNIGIVVVTDIDATKNSPEIQAVRRMLLQLQIDLYNRDFQGRETWARPDPGK